ncbi:MAG: hypothetical protein R3F17_14650 [Planctomycetota bacterium]
MPRAANGRELELNEVKADLGALREEGDGGLRVFRSRVREEVLPLVDDARWRGSLPARLWALVHSLRLRAALRRLRTVGANCACPNPTSTARSNSPPRGP